MQLPLIKDGVVVNVIEIDEDTACVTKTQHRELHAAEEVDYQRRAGEWRQYAQKRLDEIKAAEVQLFMARGVAATVKTDVRTRRSSDAGADLDRVLVAEAEVEAWETKVADMRDRPLVAKPKMERGKRWIYPEGHIVGPAGGNIGDTYDAKTGTYTPPEGKTASEISAEERAALKAAREVKMAEATV